MPLVFHNTLTRQEEPFKPIDPAGKKVKLYTCGPTVYNFAHIGNFRTYVFEDLLRRFLEARGFDVLHVMNITDVEDKIIRKVNAEKISLSELTGKFTQAFFEDRDALGIKPAHHYPRATEHLKEMFEMIQKLLADGVAYRSEEGSIYFSITKFPNYGALAHIQVEELRSGARVASDEYEKETAADFALWKAWDESDGAVAWDSPWGKGRPGWHLECSAMARKYLGDELDIHCGGVDNIFPHHQNEIAQSEACTGKTFVRYWLHSAHLRVEGQKMAKSAGNFFTIRDLLTKGYTGREIKYLLLSAHYRLPLNFTLEGLEAARQALRRIDEWAERVQTRSKAGTVDSTSRPVHGKLFDGFMAELDKDLNISGALGQLFDFIRNSNRLLDEGQLSADEALQTHLDWQAIREVLGLPLSQESIPAEVQKIAEERQAARVAKDWRKSDELRTVLAGRGWTVKDSPQGFKLTKA
jgi:cysteinyl-tRNA synthetase